MVMSAADDEIGVLKQPSGKESSRTTCVKQLENEGNKQAKNKRGEKLAAKNIHNIYI